MKFFSAVVIHYSLFHVLLVFATSTEQLAPGFNGKTFDQAKKEAQSAQGEVTDIQEAVFKRYLENFTEIPETGDYTFKGQNGVGFNLELSAKVTEAVLNTDLKVILGSDTEFDTNMLQEEFYLKTDPKCKGSKDMSETGDGCWVNYSDSEKGKFWYIDVAANTWDLPERKLNVETFVKDAKSKQKTINIVTMTGFSEFHASSKIVSDGEPPKPVEHHFDAREEQAIGEEWVGAHLPDSFDLRPGMPAIRKQGRHGSCAAFALVGALAFSSGTQQVPLSPRWVWSGRDRIRTSKFFKKINLKIQGEGMEVEQTISLAQTHGVPFEASIPYGGLDRSQTLEDLKNVVNANKDLKKEVEDGINGVGAFANTGLKKPGNVVQLWCSGKYFDIDGATDVNARGSQSFVKHEHMIKWVMNHYGPIIVSAPVWSDGGFISAIRKGTSVNVGSYKFWKRRSKVSWKLGSHAMILVAYDASGAWIRNSWGTSWGDNGYNHIPWEDLEELHCFANKWASFEPPATQGTMIVPLRQITAYPSQQLPSNNEEGSCVRENNAPFTNSVSLTEVELQDCSRDAKGRNGFEGFFFDEESKSCTIYFQPIHHADPSTETGKTFVGRCVYYLPGPRRELPKTMESKVGSEEPIKIKLEHPQPAIFRKIISSIFLFFFLILLFTATKYCCSESTTIEKTPLLDSGSLP